MDSIIIILSCLLGIRRHMYEKNSKTEPSCIFFTDNVTYIHIHTHPEDVFERTSRYCIEFEPHIVENHQAAPDWAKKKKNSCRPPLINFPRSNFAGTLSGRSATWSLLILDWANGGGNDIDLILIQHSLFVHPSYLYQTGYVHTFGHH